MLEMTLDHFPSETKLPNGRTCIIRPMEAQDEGAFREFHTVIPEEEQLFVRSEIREGTLFRRWLAHPNFVEDLPLLAFVDARLVSIGSLHQRLGGWKRHIGKVYFLTHPNYRGMGLIDRLLEEIIEASRHCGLTRLESELNGERVSAIRSMVSAGFSELVRLPKYVRDMSGQEHDYVLMGMELIPPFEDLGTGD